MKLDEKTSLISDTAIEIQEKIEYKRIGSIHMKTGMTLFSFNLQTKEVKKVEVKKESVFQVDKNKGHTGRATHNPACLYIQALNLKNAQRKADAIWLRMLSNSKK